MMGLLDEFKKILGLDEKVETFEYNYVCPSNYIYLLYMAYHNFKHKKNTDCKTWYDGCNCIIPYDIFDNEFYDELVDYLKK